ncbi:MAG: CotH kinase family protein [Lachnospiraceae bacterium]|nr:CotH kinase family protein [Lachnospiraceae bacterium]
MKKHIYSLVLLLMSISIASFMMGCSGTDNGSSKEKSGSSGSKEAGTSDTSGSEAEILGIEYPVKMSKGTGVYGSDFKLELSAEKNSDIYYTLDGSNPTYSETRIKYTKPIKITDRGEDDNYVSGVDPLLFDAANVTYNKDKDELKTKYSAPKSGEVDKITVVRAVMKNGEDYSAVTTNTYIVGEMKEHINDIDKASEAFGKPLAIMSISVDYDDLFDYEKGIYVKGKKMQDDVDSKNYKIEYRDFTNGEQRGFDANYKQRGKEWERAAHIDYIESDGTTTECKLQQDCGIRMQGNYSRSDLQKGLRIYARTDYTPNLKNFEYNFFDAKDCNGEIIKKYKKLTMRNGGNSAFINKYNDQYWQNMVRETNCETQNSRPCVVYIDGEYFGVYVLQEDYCGKLFEERYGVLDDSVVSYKGDAEVYETGYVMDDGTLPAGETDDGYFLRDLLKFYSTHDDLKSEEDYEEFIKLVDPDSVMDYFAVELWINNQWDWPGKNWLIWRATDVDDPSKKDAYDYADGRWRFCFCDVEFGGWSGKSDAVKNTIQEDNYEEFGMLDSRCKNVAVRMFDYLMTNDKWREAFWERLESLSDNEFEYEKAMENLDFYHSSYSPLMYQFYVRYYGMEAAYSAVDNLENSGGGGYNAIADFLKERPKHIKQMKKWGEKTMKEIEKLKKKGEFEVYKDEIKE